MTDELTTCPGCGGDVSQSDHGRKRLYCSDRCKQLVYRQRRRRRESAIIDTDVLRKASDPEQKDDDGLSLVALFARAFDTLAEIDATLARYDAIGGVK